ncbi:MAG: argininosuccinate synthase [Planctomycetes bacterium]|nr:argininosuccinate synthase [Planctomycetota bacterium]
MASKTAVLAFSGGLDTSFCVLALKQAGWRVATVTAQTGGFDAAEVARIEARAKELGVAKHRTVDARAALFERVLTHLIRGNVLKGARYPLSVAAERVVTAEAVARAAREEGAGAIAHGSTGAGNDQIRFDIAFAALAPDLPVLTPIRDGNLQRDTTAKALRDAGFQVAANTQTYSVNQGLWGTTVGGGATHDPSSEIPQEVYGDREASPDRPLDLTIDFETGIPVGQNGKRREAVALLTDLNEIGTRYRVGRGIHVGQTILGFTGRIAFAAPSALVLIEAHRELTKLTHTAEQLRAIDALAATYGALLHEGRFWDPVMRDIEAFLAHADRRANGAVRVRLHPHRFEIVSAQSPDALGARSGAKYGESAGGWGAEGPKGFSHFLGMPGRLAALREQGGKS